MTEPSPLLFSRLLEVVILLRYKYMYSTAFFGRYSSSTMTTLGGRVVASPLRFTSGKHYAMRKQLPYVIIFMIIMSLRKFESSSKLPAHMLRHKYGTSKRSNVRRWKLLYLLSFLWCAPCLYLVLYYWRVTLLLVTIALIVLTHNSNSSLAHAVIDSHRGQRSVASIDTYHIATHRSIATHPVDYL